MYGNRISTDAPHNMTRRGGRVAGSELPDGAVVSYKLFLKMAKAARDNPQFRAALEMTQKMTGRIHDLTAFNRMSSEEQRKFINNLKQGERKQRQYAKEENLKATEKAYAQIDAMAD
jgi:hypothetical protein